VVLKFPLFLESFEQLPARFTAGITAGVDDGGVDFREDLDLYFVCPHEWCEIPDMLEGYAGEVASPGTGDPDTTAGGGDDVAQGLPEVEALVGELPNTVNAVRVIWLADQFLEADLEMIIEVIRISVPQIGVRSPGISDDSHSNRLFTFSSDCLCQC